MEWCAIVSNNTCVCLFDILMHAPTVKEMMPADTKEPSLKKLCNFNEQGRLPWRFILFLCLSVAAVILGRPRDLDYHHLQSLVRYKLLRRAGGGWWQRHLYFINVNDDDDDGWDLCRQNNCQTLCACVAHDCFTILAISRRRRHGRRSVVFRQMRRTPLGGNGNQFHQQDVISISLTTDWFASLHFLIVDDYWNHFDGLRETLTFCPTQQDAPGRQQRANLISFKSAWITGAWIYSTSQWKSIRHADPSRKIKFRKYIRSTAADSK